MKSVPVATTYLATETVPFQPCRQRRHERISLLFFFSFFFFSCVCLFFGGWGDRRRGVVCFDVQK